MQGVAHDHSNTQADMCEVDARTAFGKKLLAEAERISEKQTIRVFTDCRELEDINAGKKNNLTSWGYDLPIEQAQKIPLEARQLRLDHVGLLTPNV